MKKILMILMIAFTMMTGLFAKVKLVSKDTFNNYIVSTFENAPFMQPQIAYFADTWEDVYEKTGVGKYSWRSVGSAYDDNETHQCFLIVKVRVKDNGDLGWICFEYPGDETKTMYVADVAY